MLHRNSPAFHFFGFCAVSPTWRGGGGSVDEATKVFIDWHFGVITTDYVPPKLVAWLQKGVAQPTDVCRDGKHMQHGSHQPPHEPKTGPHRSPAPPHNHRSTTGMKNGRTNAKRLTKGIAPPTGQGQCGRLGEAPGGTVAPTVRSRTVPPAPSIQTDVHIPATAASLCGAGLCAPGHAQAPQAHSSQPHIAPGPWDSRACMPLAGQKDCKAHFGVQQCHCWLECQASRSGPSSAKGPVRGALSGERVSHDFADVCLVDSLRALGADVPYSSSGPFRAIADGNQMLAPLGLFLTPVSFGQVGAGRYIRWKNHHFTALHIQRSTIWMTDGRFTTRVANLGALGDPEQQKFSTWAPFNPLVRARHLHEPHVPRVI